MNNLSWLLYLADVSGKFSFIFGFSSIIALCAIVGLLCYGGSIKDGYSVEVGGDRWTIGHNIQKLALKKYIFIPIVCAVIACMLPSSSTVYAIAASEMGEEVLKSSTATKAQKALDAWLDKQITPVKEEVK